MFWAIYSFFISNPDRIIGIVDAIILYMVHANKHTYQLYAHIANKLNFNNLFQYFVGRAQNHASLTNQINTNRHYICLRILYLVTSTNVYVKLHGGESRQR